MRRIESVSSYVPAIHTYDGPPSHMLLDTRCRAANSTGKERESGLDNFDARYYSNRFGRWLSADWSAAPEPVPYADLTNPQTLNLYAMVADYPESFADLDGHCDADGQHCFLQKLGNWWNGNGFKTDAQLAPQGTVTTVTVDSHPLLTPRQVQQVLAGTVVVATFGALEAPNMASGESNSTVSAEEQMAIEVGAAAAVVF